MKSILNITYVLAISFYISNLLQSCLAEPFVSSKANITPVKIHGRNSRNRSSSVKNDDALFGSIAKISRVVPLKHLNAKSIARKKLRDFPKAQKFSQNPEGSSEVIVPGFFRSRLIQRTKTTLPPLTPVPTTTTVSSTTNSPLGLSPDSWDYLNSVVTDDELRQVISSLPQEILQNATIISNVDPTAGQNFLVKNIIDELSNLKLSKRMLAFDQETVNNGVRYSAQRKPVLNVKPPDLSVKNKGSGGVMKGGTNIISGHISNKIGGSSGLSKSIKFSDDNELVIIPLEEKSGSEISTSSHFVKNPRSTTPTLLQVLSIPDSQHLDSTTPSSKSKIKKGFHSALPTLSLSLHPTVHSTPLAMSQFLDNSENVHLTPVNISSRRLKASDKEEYNIPSITSTVGPAAQTTKGYQTIPKSTTPGPQLIFYNHQNRPDDTFYPNSNNFLVPPEEDSSEILTALPPQHNIHGSGEPTRNSSFLPSQLLSPEVIRVNDGNTQSQYVNENGVRSQTRSNRGSLFSEGNKQIAVPLQPAASDHDGLRDFEDYPKNGGSSGNKPTTHYVYENRHHDGPSNSGGGRHSSKYHDDIPQYQEINGYNTKPENDVSQFTHEYDHHYYHDSYPNKHEIGQNVKGSYNGGSYQTSHGYGNSGGDKPTKTKQGVEWGGWSSTGGGGSSNFWEQGNGWKDQTKDFIEKAKDYFKKSDMSTTEKWFDVSIGVLAFLAFMGYISMLIYQVFAVSSGTPIGIQLGRTFKGAGELFDVFFSKGPIGQAYMDELETIVKRAMANVKRIWMTNSLVNKEPPKKLKGDADAN